MCSDKHTRAFLEQHPVVCAARTTNRRQWLFFGLCLALLIIGFLRDPKVAFTIVTATVCALYGVVVLFRLVSVFLGWVRGGEHRVNDEELAAATGEWPMYTILVPMYKEPEVAQKIIRAVTSLDYPQEKLDVKLLLEEDDEQTRAKIDEVADQLPKCVEVILAPRVNKGEPRTKPRACNWGLEQARGEFLVIYDAEDQPEPDQLKKAVLTFRKLEAAGQQQVACLQAKLNYFNAHQNSLTSFFTLEYTTWFDLFLPGLHATRTPIPLGGTSNHFRTSKLKELGGWDPFNVTEDCDLGIRMARHGVRTEVLDSTTWEEANSRVGNWIRQRSRWIKGYLQTHLVHTRDAVLPFLGLAALFFWLYQVHTEDARDLASGSALSVWVQATRIFCFGALLAALLTAGYSAYRRWIRPNPDGSLGAWSSLTFRFTVGGLSLLLLLNLVFWSMTALYLVREPVARILPDRVGEVIVDRTERTTLRQALRGWKLYYTNVTNEEQFRGVTLWNTLYAYNIERRLTWPEAREQIGAIDNWSFLSQIFFPIAVMLFAANFVFVLLGLVSCQKRGLWTLFPYALLMPFYWVLISIAAVKGLKQLCTNPFYWEKTQHGLSHTPTPPQPPAPPVEPPQKMEVTA